jgi:hypothetical protein
MKTTFLLASALLALAMPARAEHTIPFSDPLPPAVFTQHDPMCADETMMKWMMATLAGKKPNIDRVGLMMVLPDEPALQDINHDISKKAGERIVVQQPKSAR